MSEYHGFEVLSSFSATQQATAESSSGRCIVWGEPSHPHVPRHAIASWILSETHQRRFDRLSELLGPFVAFVDDRSTKGATVVTDFLGLMPVFIHQGETETLLAADAWTLANRLPHMPKVDGGSLACWLWFGFDCTTRSLFDGIRLLPAGSVTELTPEGRRSFPYTNSSEPVVDVSDDQLASRILNLVQTATTTLLRDRPDAVIALSGGWDSRLIAACAVEAGSKPLAVCVANSQGDAEVARKVADHLGLTLEVIRPDGDVIDLYPEWFGYASTGYPQTHFLLQEIARRHPGFPICNGFLGDSLVRGSHDRVQGSFERDHTSDFSDALMRAHSRSCGIRFVQDDLTDGIYELAKQPLQSAVAEGKRRGQVFSWVDLALRQRFYIANNFLQHADTAEPLLPFYSVDLILLKMAQDPSRFSDELYRRIFRRIDPSLADIPHSSQLSINKGKKVRGHVRRMALSLCLELVRPDSLPVVPRLRAYPRILACLAGRDDMSDYIRQMFAMHLLEARLKKAGVGLDWRDTLKQAFDESTGVRRASPPEPTN